MKLSYFSSLVPMVFSIATGVSADGDFAASCHDISLSGSTLSANCANGSGGTDYTELDLDRCLANNYGALGCTNFS